MGPVSVILHWCPTRKAVAIRLSSSRYGSRDFHSGESRDSIARGSASQAAATTADDADRKALAGAECGWRTEPSRTGPSERASRRAENRIHRETLRARAYASRLRNSVPPSNYDTQFLFFFIYINCIFFHLFWFVLFQRDNRSVLAVELFSDSHSINYLQRRWYDYSHGEDFCWRFSCGYYDISRKSFENTYNDSFFWLKKNNPFFWFRFAKVHVFRIHCSISCKYIFQSR